MNEGQSNNSEEKNKKLKLAEYKKLREKFDRKDSTGFNSVEEFGIDYQITDIGLFLPSGTVFLDKLFEDLIKDGYINTQKIFLDAGSGDGRVNHIAAMNGIKKSVGIEYSEDILEKSITQTQKFEEKNIIEKDSVKLIAGDFTNLDTYTKGEIDVKKVGTFFNYLNGWSDLLTFIDKNGVAGAKLILMDQQFKVADRVVQEISKFDSFDLLKIVKYIFWKDRDEAEILTSEIIQELKKKDSSIENQHTSLDISDKNQVSVLESDDYYVSTVYLCEKKRGPID